MEPGAAESTIERKLQHKDANTVARVKCRCPAIVNSAELGMTSKFPVDIVSVDRGNVTFIIRRSADDELQSRERNLKSDVPDTLLVSPPNIQVVEVILRAKQWCRPVIITVEGGLVTDAKLQE